MKHKTLKVKFINNTKYLAYIRTKPSGLIRVYILLYKSKKEVNQEFSGSRSWSHGHIVIHTCCSWSCWQFFSVLNVDSPPTVLLISLGKTLGFFCCCFCCFFFVFVFFCFFFVCFFFFFFCCFFFCCFFFFVFFFFFFCVAFYL